MKHALAKLVSLAVISAFALAMSSSAAHADLLNGNFSQGADGLDHWTVIGDGGVSVSGNVATLTESTFASETDLYQNFTLPPGATSLSFKLTDILANPPISNPPDFFNAALLDPKTIPMPSLVSTTDSSSDSYYIRDVVQSGPQSSAAKGVTVLPGLDSSLPITITLDVSQLAGQDVQLLFRLGGTNPDSTSTVSISDVTIETSGGGPITPEPSSFVGLLGLFSMAVLGWRFRTRKTAAVV